MDLMADREIGGGNALTQLWEDDCGKSRANGRCERFNRKLRGEGLNDEIIYSPREAQRRRELAVCVEGASTGSDESQVAGGLRVTSGSIRIYIPRTTHHGTCGVGSLPAGLHGSGANNLL